MTSDRPQRAAGASAERKTARIVLALALALALVRFARLADWSLWLDEALTWTDWHVGIEGGEIHNPIGYRLIAWAVALTGGVPDEFALRILPAIVGVLCVPLTWCAFRSFAGELRASAAALLVAVSSWHVYWSQNARFYTLAQACALVGTWLVLTAYARGRSARALIGLAAVAAGAAFHPSVVFLVPALVLAPFGLRLLGSPLDERGRRVARHVLIAGLVTAVLGAKWAWEAWSSYRIQKGLGHSGVDVAGSLVHYVRTSGFYLTPLLLAAALAGAICAWYRRERAGLFVLLVVCLCLACGLAAALFVRVSAQYVFFLLPWVALLAVSVVEREGEERAPRIPLAAARAWIAVLALPALATTVLYMTVRQGERPPWRDAYDFVWNARREGDLVLGMHASLGEYYLAPRATDLRHPSQVAWFDYFRTFDAKTWSKYPRRVWFVINPEEFQDWIPEHAQAIQRMLREECRLVKAFPLYVESRDLSIWIYLRE